MHLQSVHIRNFRRLIDTRIQFESDVSVLVGPNNSGKTSAAQALVLFLSGSRSNFSIFDFSISSRRTFDQIGASSTGAANLPRMSVDFCFAVSDSDLYRVADLVPSLDWTGGTVGLRVEFSATNPTELLQRYRNKHVDPAREADKQSPPRVNKQTLTEHLERHLATEYELAYYAIDYSTPPLAGSDHPAYRLSTEGKKRPPIVDVLVRVDCLNAQRQLSDETSNRAEDLSRLFTKYYARNLEQHQADPEALSTLLGAEAQMNEHLARVFQPTFDQLAILGYPGIDNPRLLLRSALRPETILSNGGARLHYRLDDTATSAPASSPDEHMPEGYNGLGYKNLIYMAIELLHRNLEWKNTPSDRAALHLTIIEEPESHLHVQLQQAFIRQVFALLGPDDDGYKNQLVITTHSPHILYERGFKPVRYFKKSPGRGTRVLDVSRIESASSHNSSFLERYMKLSHCDLFFADAAVIVEGSAERILLPEMINRCAPELRTAYLSILEIGGAYAHVFRPLLDFLEIPTLVVTDLDSVLDQRTCPTWTKDASSSNPVLTQWLPGKSSIANLLTNTSADERTQLPGNQLAHVLVVYQTSVAVSWCGGAPISRAGRTFEEAFALENLPWCQSNRELGLAITDAETLPLPDLLDQIYQRVQRETGGFKKVSFALGVLADQGDWVVPLYITQGLRWLAELMTPSSANNVDRDP